MPTVTLEKIASLCKRRGFVYPSAEIYGGLNGLYDFGHLGTLLKENIRKAWRQSMVQAGYPIVFMEGTILGPEQVWQASGHVANFHDPMVDCLSCKKRYRTDEIDLNKPCPHCGNTSWTAERQFNMMFKSELGASAESASTAYLRPETAQAIFVNFKNVITTNRVKIPFGIAQIGKAFRNEITPKQFLFRMREFEQMEMEFFCTRAQSNELFTFWTHVRKDFYSAIGITLSRIRLRSHEKDELSHYSSQTTDIEYEFPFGFKELEGIAHRTNFDLTQHSKHSGKELSVYDDETKTSYIPDVVECSVGVDRLFLTILFDAYHEDLVEGEERVVLKLHPKIAPVKAAFLPLVKKLNEPTQKLYRQALQAGLQVEFDESGSIGKRYRRQDEIGTPFCVTFDFDSLEDNCVTVRSRDTLQQERMPIDEVVGYIQKLVQ